LPGDAPSTPDAVMHNVQEESPPKDVPSSDDAPLNCDPSIDENYSVFVYFKYHYIVLLLIIYVVYLCTVWLSMLELPLVLHLHFSDYIFLFSML
jgi:hypothetical protein